MQRPSEVDREREGDGAPGHGAPDATAGVLEGPIRRPAVVGLAARAALDDRHADDRLRELVARHVVRGRLAQVVVAWVAASAELDDGHDLLAPSLARAADHHHVEHGRVALEGLLDLLGEHLLAAGVDGDRVAAQELQRPVGEHPGPVAGHRVADAVDHREGAGGLRRVAEVPARHPAGLGEPAELGVAGASRRARSLDSTTLVGERSKVPVEVPRERSDSCTPWRPVSDEPSTSTIRRWGTSSRSSSFTLADSVAPPVRRWRRLETSWGRSGSCSRSASTSGRAKASPTMSSDVARSRSTVSSTSWGSRRAGSSWMTTVPPVVQHDRAFQWAAPCMNGGAGRARRVERRAPSTSCSVVWSIPRHAARKSAWRHSTPLGMPVVPPV